MRQNQNSYTYFIRRSIQALLLAFILNSFASAQTIKVTGRVTSNAGDTAIAGASIIVKGTTKGVSASENGEFTLTVRPDATLIITAIGYGQQEIKVNNQTSISVKMIPEATTLQQIVVIGYGTQKRSDISGAVSSVSAAQIEAVPITTAEQALQGRAAGVQIINNDGAPGGNISILIRGVGSLASGGNTPLYVVDGYPTTGGINNINPNDIASIDILKDASAAAVYGIRAANGVVIITTKRGLKNRVQVSFDMYEAAQSKPKEYDLLNAQQFATLSNYVEATDSTHSYHGLSIWHTPSALHSVDWQNALYHPGLTQSYNVSIRGGSDKVQSSAAFGFYNQKGIVLGSYFKRFTVGFNLDYQPTTWLKSSTSIRYTYQDANTPLGTGGLYQLDVNPPTLDSGNSQTYLIKDGKGNYGFYNPIDPNVFKFSNPVYSVETNQSKNITNFVLASSSLEATLFDGFKIKTNLGVNISDYSGSFFQPEDDRENEQYPAAIVAAAYFHENLNNNFEWLWENTVSYDKTFGLHKIDFVGGVSAQEGTDNLMGGGGIPPNSIIRDLGQVTNLQLDPQGNGQLVQSLASEFARLNYEYNDKYFLSATVRRDGSSKFDTGHQYGVFPAGSVAWKIKNEAFLKDVNWLSDLKLRASYGVLGNNTDIGLFKYAALYEGNFPASLNGGTDPNGNPVDNLGYPFDKIYQNGITSYQPENPNLKWETDYTTDFGLDAAFLNGALTVTGDWYNRQSKNFLLNIQAPAQTGYNFLALNVGNMVNKGVELAVNYSGNRGRDFHYNIGVTFSTNKNTLTALTDGTPGLQNFGGLGLTGNGWGEFSYTSVGGPVGEFYGYKSLGIFQSQAQIDALNAKAPGGIYWQAATSPGDRYYADINGDGVVNASDMVPLGNPQPKFIGGFNFDGMYKQWDFNLFFNGVYGNKILNYIESDLESFQKRGSEGVENVSANYYNNYWTPTRPSNTYARPLAVDDQTLNSVPSSAWIQNGSYLKLKNITIGYTLPGSISKKYTLSKLRMYIQAQNLFTITKYTGLDPEIGIQNGNATQFGVDNGTYPSSRYFTFGLNVTF